MGPNGEESSTNSSEGIYQSFQEGELPGLEAQPDGSEARPTLVQGVVVDETTCHDSAVDGKKEPLDTRNRISEENKRRQPEIEQGITSMPTTKAQGQTNRRSVAPAQGLDCKSHIKGQRKEDAQTCPSQAVSTEQRRLVFAADEQGTDRSHRASATGTGNEEDECGEDALLLSHPSVSQGSQLEHGEGVDGGVGHGSALENIVRKGETPVEAAAEEIVVDDVDDESSTLLGRPPVAHASCSESVSKSASTSTVIGAVRAASVAAAAVSASPSSASSPAGGVTGEDTPSLPVSNPAAVAAPVSTPTSTPTAATTTFNYYELPAIPEKAPEATEQPVNRSARVSDALANSLRQPSLSRARTTEEHVSNCSSLLMLPYWRLTYARRLLGD